MVGSKCFTVYKQDFQVCCLNITFASSQNTTVLNCLVTCSSVKVMLEKIPHAAVDTVFSFLSDFSDRSTRQYGISVLYAMLKVYLETLNVHSFCCRSPDTNNEPFYNNTKIDGFSLKEKWFRFQRPIWSRTFNGNFLHVGPRREIYQNLWCLETSKRFTSGIF